MFGIVESAGHLAVAALPQVQDVSPVAPPGVGDKANVVFGWGMWLSVSAAFLVLLTVGLYSFAGDRGYGGGVPPQIMSRVTTACVVVIIVFSAAGLINMLAA